MHTGKTAYSLWNEDYVIQQLVQPLKFVYNPTLTIVKMVQPLQNEDWSTTLSKLSLPGVDVVIGLGPNFLTTTRVKIVNGITYIIQSASDPKVGIVDFEHVNGSPVVKYSERSLYADVSEQTRSSPEYMKDVEFLNTYINTASQNDPVLGISLGPFSTQHCRIHECEHGNFWATALMDRYAHLADVAVINGGWMSRTAWSPGPINVSAVYSSSPFSGLTCVFSTWGDDLWNVMNHSVSAVPAVANSTTGFDNTGRFLQTKNIRYAYNSNRNRSGHSRLIRLEVWNNFTKRYEVVSRGRIYRVATLQYICDGGDGFGPFLKPIQSIQTLDSIHNIGINYIRSIGTLEPFLDNHIRRDLTNSVEFSLPPQQQRDCVPGTMWVDNMRDCVLCPRGYEQPLSGQTECVEIVPYVIFTSWLIAILVVIPVLLVGLMVFIMYQNQILKARTRNVKNAPSGKSVAIVFTDIQNSTKLWNTASKSMQGAVQIHHRIIRKVIDRYRSYEVKTIGDSFMIAAKDAATAVRIAHDIHMELLSQEWDPHLLAHEDARSVVNTTDEFLFHGLRVRIGVHVGFADRQWDVVSKGFDYYGDMVNIAARVESVARGGQTLVTSEVVQAIRCDDALMERSSIRALGKVSLKGIEEPVHVHEVMPLPLQEREFELNSSVVLDNDGFNVSLKERRRASSSTQEFGIQVQEVT